MADIDLATIDTASTFPDVGDVVESANPSPGGRRAVTADGSTFLAADYPSDFVSLFAPFPFTSITPSVLDTGNFIRSEVKGTTGVIGLNQRIAYTTNSGASFSNLTVNYSVVSDVAVSTSRILVAGSTSSGGGGVSGVLTVNPTDNTQSVLVGGSAGSGVIYHFVAADGDNILVAGNVNPLTYSTNDGGSFTAPTTNPIPNATNGDILGDFAVIVDANNIAISTNAGQTFTATATTPTKTGNFDRVALVSTTNFYVTTTTGQIHVTTDGGATFTLLSQSIFTAINPVRGISVVNGRLYTLSNTILYETENDFTAFEQFSVPMGGSTAVSSGSFSSSFMLIAANAGGLHSLRDSTTFNVPNITGSGAVRSRIIVE